MREVFSPTEKEILKVLGKKKMTISEITEKFYSSGRSKPLEPNNYIASALSRIAKKAKFHDLSWRIGGTRDASGRTVWREERGD